eukprot:9330522-Heterocapsa_arctica.AAC.1
MCQLCKGESSSSDPVADARTTMTDAMEPILGPAATLRWTYPAVDGVPQGNFCWYCTKVVECSYIGMGMNK